MKRLLLLLPLLLVTGCGYGSMDEYGSMIEADADCESWVDKGGRILQALSTDDEPYMTFIRGCEYERATRQFLGYDIPGAQVGTTYIGDGKWVGTTYTNENGHVLGRRVITKRFKY